MNVSMEWPSPVYAGDSIDLPVIVDEDITDWKIRVEIYSSGRSGCGCGAESNLKLASANVTGGSDDEVSIEDVGTGETETTFTIHIAKTLTDDFPRHNYIEVELEDTDGKLYTIIHQPFRLNFSKIDWDSSNE